MVTSGMRNSVVPRASADVTRREDERGRYHSTMSEHATLMTQDDDYEFQRGDEHQQHDEYQEEDEDEYQQDEEYQREDAVSQKEPAISTSKRSYGTNLHLGRRTLPKRSSAFEYICPYVSYHCHIFLYFFHHRLACNSTPFALQTFAAPAPGIRLCV
ncbi:hypothetical protein PRZ48_008820 [Zasmidium cellare]|uniref:Uncharacterized protein n=1 Tax=Zasmidium cellare TaxID=395010 RepID=A0ABR0EHB5_ZASCE|nr:hypothetical protein PRZ48_008820 [Zasmidium cellare]